MRLEGKVCIVTGGAVTGCVDDTVQEGTGLGYEFTVVSDATFPLDSPYLQLMTEWAEVKSTREVLELLTRLDRGL